MANIASNTYLFYGDKDEIVKCHEMLNDLYEVAGGASCVEPKRFTVQPEWINYIDDINPGVDDRFYMGTESKCYGNPVYWHNWVKSNFTNLAVAFRSEEPATDTFNQIDPDNVLQDRVWVEGLNIPADDLSKLPQEIRGCAGKDGDDTYYLCGSFDKDELFNSDFKPADVPESITVREYDKLTYEKLIEQDAKLKVFHDLLAEKFKLS
jgi:hypothetical protein